MMNEIIKEEFEKTLENVDPSSVVRVRILLHCIFCNLLARVCCQSKEASIFSFGLRIFAL